MDASNVGYKLCQNLCVGFVNTKRHLREFSLRILVISLKRNVFSYLNGEEAFNAILCVKMYRKCSM